MQFTAAWELALQTLWGNSKNTEVQVKGKAASNYHKLKATTSKALHDLPGYII